MLADPATFALASLPPATSAIDLTDGLPLFALAALAWLFTYALHSTLLLGSAWLATRRMADARAGLRERVWKFAVLAAFVTASVQVGMGFEPLGGRLPLRRSPAIAQGRSGADLARDEFEFAGAQPREFAVVPAAAAPWYLLLARQGIAELESRTGAALEYVLRERPRAVEDGEMARSEMREEQPAPAAITAQVPWIARLGEWKQWAFATCALGALAGLCLFALLWLRLNGCLRDRVALEQGALFDKLEQLRERAKLRRRVLLSVAPSLGAPISMGMFRPEICVPPRVLLELSDEEQEALLAHELAHVVRRDPLWLAACRLFEGVFFFQPMNRVARHEIEDCAEFLSDAWAVRHTGLRFSLASCLTRIAEWIVGERRSLVAPAMAHGRSRLRHRVELLLDESAAENVDRHPRWLSVACTGFCAALVAIVPCVSASDTSLASGDGARLAFLPDRDALALQPLSEKTSDENSACLDAANQDEAARGDARPHCTDDAAAQIDGDLGSELQALAVEFTLLQSEVAALDQKDARARELAFELTRLKMNLARARELNSRIESLRAALASTANAAVAPVRKARSNPPAHMKSSINAPTPIVNLEETSK